MHPQFRREGSFAASGFAEILRDAVRCLADGRLDVLCGATRRSIWLEVGQVRAISSESEDEKLGQWLVSSGAVAPDRMARALLRQPEATLYGRHLVAQGALGVWRLHDELRTRAVALVARMLDASGSFWFSPGARFPADALVLESTTGGLLADAVRSRAATDREWLAALLPADHCPRHAADALLLFQKVGLRPEEAYLFSRIDGRLAVNALRRLVPAPEEEFMRALAVLVAVGLVEPAPGPERTVAAQPPVRPPAAAGQQKAGETDAPRGSDDEDRLVFTPRERGEYHDVVRLAAELRNRSFYHRLRLPPGSTQDQIHARYLELAALYHPDRAEEAHLRGLRRELAEISECLREAYDTLVTPEQRARYDQGLRSAPPSSDEAGEAEARRIARHRLAEANLARARELIALGDVGAAIQLLDQAVRFDPQPAALLLLAHLEMRNPSWVQRALDRLRLAVTVAPDCTEAWLELANFWAGKGQSARQRQCLERVLDVDPDNREARSMVAALRPTDA